jgi:Recombination endonuclease VII
LATEKTYTGKIAPGQVYSNWTVIKHAGRTERAVTKWLSRCHCGREAVISAYRLSKLKTGASQATGCKSCFQKTPEADCRVCRQCGKRKPDSAFTRTAQKSGTVGCRQVCKVCISHNSAARKFNLPSAVIDMVLGACDSCEICGRAFNKSSKSTTPHIDHCHVTHRVRSVLCSKCNSLIGFADENPAILEAAANYVRRHHQTSVLAFPSFFEEPHGPSQQN